MQNSRGKQNKPRAGDRESRDSRDNRDKDGFRSSLPRPDVSAYKRDIAQRDNEVAKCIQELNEIKSKQDKIRNERNHGRKEFDEAKSLMSKLINKKKEIFAERNTIQASRDASHKRIVNCQEKEKQARSAIKFNSIDAIDKQIKELETRQSRTSMSLTEEKNLVKEIKALNLSKKSFAALSDMKSETDREKAAKSSIDQAFSEINAKLKEINQRLDAQKVVLDGLNKTSSETGKMIPEFKKRQDELRATIDAENAAIKALRVSIKEKEDGHAVAVAEEKKKWKEEQAELKKKREAEELAKHPYEEEMYICDFLINYLSSKFSSDAKDDAAETPSSTTTSSLDTVFAGMKSLKRNDDETFMGGGVVKKKGKKKGGQNNKEDITHTHESLENFSSVGVAAPAKLSAVPDCLKQLNEKKEYFNTLERGAIPSLKSLRAKKESGKSSSKSKSSKQKEVLNVESNAEYPGL